MNQQFQHNRTRNGERMQVRRSNPSFVRRIFTQAPHS